MSVNAVTRRMRIIDLLISLGIMVLTVVGALGNLTSFKIGSVLLNVYGLYEFHLLLSYLVYLEQYSFYKK